MIINNLHDKFFRSAMSNTRVARDFLEQYLPKNILSSTDLSTLQLQKESFIDSNLKQMISDVLYKVKIKECDSYIYLLVEHQSTPDRFMAFRLLRYVCRIMGHHIKNLKNDSLPVVVPLVFYHGRQFYPYGTDIFELFGASRELAKSVLLQPFHLIDVNNLSDEVLTERVWSGVLTFIQKHIFERDILRYYEEIVPLLKKLMTEGADDYIISIIQYVMNAGSIGDVQQFVRLASTLSPTFGDEVMTLAERLRLEGLAEGKAEGKVEGRAEGREEAATEIAKKLLTNGVDLKLVAHFTGLSTEAINSLVISEVYTR